MDRTWLLCLGLVVLTYSLAHLYRVVASALQILDHPDHRSAHRHATPTGAGIVFILSWCLALYLLSLNVVTDEEQLLYDILPGLLLVALIGAADDMRPLPWLVRAPVHFIAAIWVIFQTSFPPLNVLGVTFDTTLAGLIFGVVALVWLLNLYNFMDGIDGIAIGEAVMVLAGASVIAVFVDGGDLLNPVLVLIAACTGFLLINWPKARVFMGDAGSGFLGLLLGALALSESLVSVWTWLILLGWFITDATLTITLRLIRGEKIHEPHSLHAYQHLNRSVGTPRTLAIIGAINAFWLLPVAAGATLAQEWAALLLILAFLPLVIFQFYCGAGQLSPRLGGLKPAQDR